MPELLAPPQPVRDCCCDGLALARAGRPGATVPALAVAQVACGGGLLTAEQVAQMVVALDAIEELAMGGDSSEALRVSWRLWGGDDGQAWARGVLRPGPVLASASDDDARLSARLSAALADADRAAGVRVHEAAVMAVEVAFARVSRAADDRLRRPSGAVLASLAGDRAERDRIVDVMRAAPLADQWRAVPDPVFAALGIDALDLIRPVVADQLSGRVRAVLGDAFRDVDGAWAEAGLDLSGDARLGGERAADLDEAVALLGREVVALIEAELDGSPLDDPADAGEGPAGRVPFGLALRVLARAGGGPADLSRDRPVVETPSGPVTAGAGVAAGPTTLRAVARAMAADDGADAGGPVLARVDAGSSRAERRAAARASGDVPRRVKRNLLLEVRTRWVWGGAARPFPPHRSLHDSSWATEDERRRVCANPDPSFPRVAVLVPGDHKGCTCWTAPVVAVRNFAANR